MTKSTYSLRDLRSEVEMTRFEVMKHLLLLEGAGLVMGYARPFGPLV